MDAFCDRMAVHAATIDELLSDDFQPLPGQKGDADLAARRLAAWCRSCASGDWSLFARRLDRDGVAIIQALTKFATVRRRPTAAAPAWLDDATWIEAALHSPTQIRNASALDPAVPCAFEQLFSPLADRAEARLWSGLEARTFARLGESARICLRVSLLKRLSDLSTPAIYERFDQARKGGAPPGGATPPQQSSGTARYDRFVADMKSGGFRRLFEDKPVLLRLVACVTRQWLDTSRQLLVRLDADLPAIRGEILRRDGESRVARIQGDFSDPHNGGQSVQIITFEDGSRLVYKPKDLRVDVAWCSLIDRLNRADAPIELKAVRAIARQGYGWTEFIDHTGCADEQGCGRFFRRAGAWLALFHCFAATDLHQENLIAAGDHPVPIDLETILQATADEHKSDDAEGQALAAATEIIANSVMTVGLLPAYVRSADNKLVAMGGMTADWNSTIRLDWQHINSDAMRPASETTAAVANPNLPHIDGRYAKFGDHVEEFIAGFEAYANFLLRRPVALFADFAGLPVRKVVRATRFYYMLLQRLKNHRAMDDGVAWSAQADFVARLADWEKDFDPHWPLQRAERSALVSLNVPHFLSLSDGSEIYDATGVAIRTDATSGLDRARARLENFDEREIAWQVEVIRQNTSSIAKSSLPPAMAAAPVEPSRLELAVDQAPAIFGAEADRIAAELARHAIRRGPNAAWIGLDWLGDAEVFQLVALGPDLYNGLSGIALFLAAHAASRSCSSSRELALAAVSHLRKTLHARNAARTARSLGIGGAIGLGSIVYALAVMAKSLHDDGLLADAHAAAELFTGDLIATDRQLDVIGGSAGAILGLLRLYRDTQSPDVLDRAIKCGEHLLGQTRQGTQGHRSWVGRDFGARALNGMSHGAAGFAYALFSLSATTGRDDFGKAAAECIAFENSSYDTDRHNWPDFRGGEEPSWPCQWCHGAPGIGLARIAMRMRGRLDAERLAADAGNAVEGVRRAWPIGLDTLCCGTLGGIEFLSTAGAALGRADLSQLAAQRLLAVVQAAAAQGDYRWNGGDGRFNLGLFRGLAGVGYTLLRRTDASLPNILVWE